MMQKTANKPTIAVDIDEVLVENVHYLLDWYNRKYGTKLTLADNYSNNLEPWGVKTREEAVKRVHGFINSPNLTKLKPFKDAITVLNKLSVNYNLVVVTARDTIVEKATRNWLDKHFQDLFSEAHFTAEYSLDGPTKTKAQVCKQIGATYLVEDRLDIVKEASKVGIKCLLFGDYPWSRHNRLPTGVTKVKNWSEVLEYFDAESR